MITLLPDNVVSDLKRFMVNTDCLNKYYGHHFTMVMKDENSNYTFHDRPNQPCIGGNLRKYGASHGEECTRPKDSCPGDLKNTMSNTDIKYGTRDKKGQPIWRFPDGIPSGVGYYTGFSKEQTEYVRLCYSEKSPWLKGFGSPEAVEFLYLPNNPDAIAGVIIKTGDFDPTVLIHLQKHLQNNYMIVFKNALSKGFDSLEALVLTAFTTGINKFYDLKTHKRENRDVFIETGFYSFDPHSNIKRMINREPLDLTGGLWSSRYDYNRPDLALVFRDKQKDKFNFIKTVNEEAYKNNEDLYITALRLMRKAIEDCI